MRKILFLYLIPTLLLAAVSCQRDDDEPPARPEKPISRLYVSTSDYQAGASSNLENLWVIDPADDDSFGDANNIKGIVSGAKGGKTIHYSPLNQGMVFQSSINSFGTNDTSVQVLSINLQGLPTYRAKLSNRRLDNVRGMNYVVVNNNEGTLNQDFLLALQKSDTVATPYLFAFYRPVNSGFLAKPRFQMPLDFIPWGLKIQDKDMYIVRTGDADNMGAVVAYKDFTQKLIERVDSTLTNIKPSYTLSIAGAHNLRGIAYSKEKDIMVITDYNVSGNTVSNGRILIFDNFSANNTDKSISPSRVITGAATKLVQPMDVAMDERPDGKYIYVADSGAKRVFRYMIEDSGNVAPNGELNLKNRTPESISLDSR
ncbi:hypothetical protein [Sphingobacterium composti Ten et al. 2007 non Yoo et al. 2007]|uniref:hypothetical protein n=1 Tax=Sphingobacterium composti TaxID=363260 RepID=UPI001356AE84|nr:hypothetical protein [Sphingobacterium composti Ten et al. 2007 non Yoo et al. 2007]